MTNDSGFRIIESASLPRSTRAREDELGEICSYRGRGGFEVLISDSLVERLCAISHNAEPNEWIGILIGRVGEDDQGSYVIVDGLVLDTDAIATPGSVRSTVRGEQRVREIAAAAYPGSEVLGWAHSHHRCGTHFSPGDRDNQATWSAPHALGIVCDPRAPERIGVYRGPGSERLVLERPQSKTPATRDASTVQNGACRHLSAALRTMPTMSRDNKTVAARSPQWAPFLDGFMGLTLIALAWQIATKPSNIDISHQLERIEHSVLTLSEHRVQPPSASEPGTFYFGFQNTREDDVMCTVKPPTLVAHELE